MEQIDYLVIGHITCDVTSSGNVVGGTVSYSGRVAHALGCCTAVVTSCLPDYDGLNALSDLHIHLIPAPATTTFENVYTAGGRHQTLHAIADPITVSTLPEAWSEPAIVHLGPLANEVDPHILDQFDHSLIGLTPQGWLRRWDENGRVYARDWEAAPRFLPLADAVFLSREDLLSDDMLDQYRQVTSLLILTENVDGCTVFYENETRRLPAPAVTEVEPTGAGDIFATAFLIRFQKNGRDPFDAAHFANFVAAHSVTQVGLEAKVKHIQSIIHEH